MSGLREQDWCFRARSITGDYHDERNAERLRSGSMTSFCLIIIPPNSLKVIHNALYHSGRLDAVPNEQQCDMQDWLSAHNIEYPEHALKRDHFALICLSNPKLNYVVDDMAKASGHKVLRLPPYHCELKDART